MNKVEKSSQHFEEGEKNKVRTHKTETLRKDVWAAHSW